MGVAFQDYDNDGRRHYSHGSCPEKFTASITTTAEVVQLSQSRGRPRRTLSGSSVGRWTGRLRTTTGGKTCSLLSHVLDNVERHRSTSFHYLELQPAAGENQITAVRTHCLGDTSRAARSANGDDFMMDGLSHCQYMALEQRTSLSTAVRLSSLPVQRTNLSSTRE